jgi:hypothetical protein
MEEPFQRGESVTLRDAAAPTLGRIVSVSPDGSRAEVAWHRRPGHEHETTSEPTTELRRAHESELFDTP